MFENDPVLSNAVLLICLQALEPPSASAWDIAPKFQGPGSKSSCSAVWPRTKRPTTGKRPDRQIAGRRLWGPACHQAQRRRRRQRLLHHLHDSSSTCPANDQSLLPDFQGWQSSSALTDGFSSATLKPQRPLRLASSGAACLVSGTTLPLGTICVPQGQSHSRLSHSGLGWSYSVRRWK